MTGSQRPLSVIDDPQFVIDRLTVGLGGQVRGEVREIALRCQRYF